MSAARRSSKKPAFPLWALGLLFWAGHCPVVVADQICDYRRIAPAYLAKVHSAWEFYQTNFPPTALEDPKLALLYQDGAELVARRARSGFPLSSNQIYDHFFKSPGAETLPFEAKHQGNIALGAWARSQNYGGNRQSLPPDWMPLAARANVHPDVFLHGVEFFGEARFKQMLHWLMDLKDQHRLWEAVNSGKLAYLTNPSIGPARQRFYSELATLGMPELPPFERALLFSSLRGKLHGEQKSGEANPELVRSILIQTQAMLATWHQTEGGTRQNFRHGGRATDQSEERARQLLLRAGIEILAEHNQVYSVLKVFQSRAREGRGSDDVAADFFGHRASDDTYIIGEVKYDADVSSEHFHHALQQLEVSGDYAKSLHGEAAKLEFHLFVEISRTGQSRMPAGYAERQGILYGPDKKVVRLHGRPVLIERVE